MKKVVLCLAALLVFCGLASAHPTRAVVRPQPQIYHYHYWHHGPVYYSHNWAGYTYYYWHPGYGYVFWCPVKQAWFIRVETGFAPIVIVP